MKFEEAIGIGLIAGIGVFAVFVRKLDSKPLLKAPSSYPTWFDVTAGAASALAPHHPYHFMGLRMRRNRRARRA